MHEENLRHLFEQVASGKLDINKAIEQSRTLPIEDTINGLTLDTTRTFRTGLGEVVFAQNKSDAQLISAIENLAKKSPVLATRVNEKQAQTLQKHFKEGHFLMEGGLFSLGKDLPSAPPFPSSGDVLVMSAGAADRPVALEAYGTLYFWGINAGFIADVGVAGLHRLTPHIPAMSKASVIITVAGMEGALPGVLAGLVRCPVLAVPTSVGYGVGHGGFAALSTMLCTCVPGVAVCNIDNGFGAAAFAAKSLWNNKE